jgi:S-adenosylmethionine:diacylglycerol 3-amino-3-carboxypropyl transferase
VYLNALKYVLFWEEGRVGMEMKYEGNKNMVAMFH